METHDLKERLMARGEFEALFRPPVQKKDASACAVKNCYRRRAPDRRLCPPHCEDLEAGRITVFDGRQSLMGESLLLARKFTT